LSPFLIAEIHVADRNSLRASQLERCDHLVMLTRGVVVGPFADHRLQLDEASEANDIVEVNARVAKYQQMTHLLDDVRARKSAPKDVSKGHGIAGRAASILGRACFRRVLAVIRDQFATGTVNRPQLQAPFGTPKN